MIRKRYKTSIFMLSFCLLSPIALANYGKNLCQLPQYNCLKITGNQSWASLFPDPETRLLVKKINRMNTPLHRGNVIAVPKNIDTANIMDFAPFPSKISPSNMELIKVDLSELAWGAYDEQGNLVNWGPISGGKNYCPDTRRGCKTITGTYTFYRKQGAGCVSSRYPIPKGGAPMPYCMHFEGGYAMHGSPTVPGYHASHGCVRLFTEDAKWLNHFFVDIGYTKVTIVP